MGRHDFSMVYTDTSEHAAWRATAGTSWPWDETPAFATLPYFTLAMIRIDWMHTFHMGVCRDLLGSALRIMASSRHWFNGRNIEIRLKQIYRAVKKFAKEQNKQISIKRLTKKSLGWGKQCPEFKGSAADSGIFLVACTCFVGKPAASSMGRTTRGSMVCGSLVQLLDVS